MWVVNFVLRHNKFSLFLIIHNLYGNQLFTEITLCPHIFLAYSSLGYYALRQVTLFFDGFVDNRHLLLFACKTYIFLLRRKFQPRLGDKAILDFYREIPQLQFHFLYINNQKNYLINCVDNLFHGKPATMYANSTVFVIHPHKKPCASNTAVDTSNAVDTVDQQILSFLQTSYPKQKHLPLMFNILRPHTLFDEHLFFKQFKNIHIADFISFILNRFCKLDTTDSRFIKLCKYLQSLNIRLPKIVVKNPLVHKYLCD